MENTEKHNRPQSSLYVAEYLLQALEQSDKRTSALGIIKLVYLCHAWMLGVHGRPMISEPVEAWRYGPVVPSVYQRYKHWRSSNIRETDVEVKEGVLDEEQESIIQQVVEAYGDFLPWQLSSITHEKGTPWHEVYNGGKGLFEVIPDEKIKDYYQRKQATGA